MKFSEIFLAANYKAYRNEKEEEEEEEEDGLPLFDYTVNSERNQEIVDTNRNSSTNLRCSTRIRKQPDWLSTSDIERIDYNK